MSPSVAATARKVLHTAGRPVGDLGAP